MFKKSCFAFTRQGSEVQNLSRLPLEAKEIGMLLQRRASRFSFPLTFDHILITYAHVLGHPDFGLAVIKRHVIHGLDKFLIADPSVSVINRFSFAPMA